MLLILKCILDSGMLKPGLIKEVIYMNRYAWILFALFLGIGAASGQDLQAIKQAAELGNTDAQVKLGYMYNNGEGVARNDTEALKWYKLAAENGNAQGQNDLGNMYREGEGGPKNDVEASRWYTLAAVQGHASAQNHLGYNYYIGAGVPKDDTEAIKWYKLAVVQDHAHSQFNLGVMYDNGEGVPQNKVMAYVWYMLSAEKGFRLAIENKELMGSKLSQAQISEAKKIASRCRDSNYRDCNL